MTRLPLLLAALAAAAARAQPLPACPGELLRKTAFTVCHGAAYKAPLWTAYRVDRRQLNTFAADASRRFRFRADRALTLPGAEDRDYLGSGFTRGHLVPAADMRFSEAALRDSYLLSNAIPQSRSFNAGQWRALEETIRIRAAQAGAATVYTGAVFCPDGERLGPGQVAVPCQLYKVAVFGEGKGEAILAVLIPNGENPVEPWETFATTVETIEKLAGLTFPVDKQAK